MYFKSLYLFGFTAVLSLSACGAEAPAPSKPDTKVQAPASAPAPAAAIQTAEQRGARVFKKCRTCHTLKEGEKHKVGPNLYNIMGAVAGQKEGFNYSKVMAASEITWTDENLDGYLARPNQFMPGNQMTFIGLRKPEDRAAVIAYLHQETKPQ